MMNPPWEHAWYSTVYTYHALLSSVTPPPGTKTCPLRSLHTNEKLRRENERRYVVRDNRSPH